MDTTDCFSAVGNVAFEDETDGWVDAEAFVNDCGSIGRKQSGCRHVDVLFRDQSVGKIRLTDMGDWRLLRK